jgi:hypothetical protein
MAFHLDRLSRLLFAAFGAMEPADALLRFSARPLFAAALGLLLAMNGCAPTETKVTQRYEGPNLPRPDMIVVRDFAVTADEVKLDSGVSARVQEAMSGSSVTAQQAETGRKVAAAVSETLVQEIGALGLPVTRAVNASGLAGGKTLIIDGQLLSVDEGNRTRRNIIGLGAGRSKVEAEVQVSYVGAGIDAPQVESLAADAESARKPGAAETMGAGGIAGRVAESAGLSVGAGTISETRSANVDADGQRLGKAIAQKLASFFAREGWIASSAVPSQ